MKTVVFSTAISFLIMSAGLAAYDRFVMNPAVRIGVIDLALVYQETEAQLATRMSQAKDDAGRSAVLAGAEKFGALLPDYIAQLSVDCRCMIMLKSAVASDAGRGIDLTDQLRRKVTQK